MKIGIIGPSKLEYVEEINSDSKDIIKKLAGEIAESGNEIVVVPDRGSVSEFFGLEYEKNKGKQVYSMIPLDDKEFGYDWVNSGLGKKINCGSWRNQPEKLNEETDVLVCLGYSTGGMIEIGYSKWFKKKPVYIIKELISGELPKDVFRDLDIRYVSIEEIGKILK